MKDNSRLRFIVIENLKMIQRASNLGRADQGFLTDCRTAIQEVASDATVILYGSRARGDAQEDSDYDLLVLVDREPDMELERSIVARLLPLELSSDKILTVLVYNRSQWDSRLYRAMPFHKNVTREGLEI
jgi:predicted nucleotidyltransferase